MPQWVRQGRPDVAPGRGHLMVGTLARDRGVCVGVLRSPRWMPVMLGVGVRCTVLRGLPSALPCLGGGVCHAGEWQQHRRCGHPPGIGVVLCDPVGAGCCDALFQCRPRLQSRPTLLPCFLCRKRAARTGVEGPLLLLVLSSLLPVAARSGHNWQTRFSAQSRVLLLR